MLSESVGASPDSASQFKRELAHGPWPRQFFLAFLISSTARVSGIGAREASSQTSDGRELNARSMIDLSRDYHVVRRKPVASDGCPLAWE
jgi:hypothetical protein